MNTFRRGLLAASCAAVAALCPTMPAIASPSRGFEVENQGNTWAYVEGAERVERCPNHEPDCHETYPMAFEGRPRDGDHLDNSRFDRWELRYMFGHIYAAKITYRISFSDARVEFTIITSSFSNDSTCRVIPASAGHCVAQGLRLEFNVPVRR